MLSTFVQYNGLSLLILQAALAIIFIYHGWPKLTSPEKMAAALNWPQMAVRLLGAVEVLGALSILFGYYVEPAALALSFVMLGAIWMKITKWHTPFFSQTSTGWEFDFILLAANIFLLTN